MNKKFSTLVFCIACIFLMVGCENNTTRKQYYKAGENVYIGETMQYDDIDVTVNQLTISKNENTYSDYYGLYLLDISLLLKNNRTKEFDFSYDNVYIKTEDRGEKYDYTSLGDTVRDVYKDVFFGETIIAGASKTIHIGFYVPYTLQEKKYVMCVDWGILNFEYEYFLYLSDGSNFYNGNIA